MKLDRKFYIEVKSENVEIIVKLLYSCGYTWGSDTTRELTNVNIHPDVKFLIITSCIGYVDSLVELNMIWDINNLTLFTFEQLLTEIETNIN